MAENEQGDVPEEPEESLNQVEDDGDELPKGVRDRIEAFVPDLVRRTFAAGLGALFTTEDGIRRITKEVPMPKEVAGYMAKTAAGTKDEVLRIIARETREFLQTVNFSEEIARMLTTLSFEIKTEIRFIPNDEKYGGVEPDVNAKVRLKRSDKQGEGGWRKRRKTKGPDHDD
ncbi:MAG: hypothetical protein KJO07_21960 [Deltaproteobacteria bacterium]|jgi:hypothetical protein|nr:hypothetical protein [Deltaproteobacteria bacterium]